MAEDVLKNLSDRLASTIKETNELFRAFRVKDATKPENAAATLGGGAKLKSIEKLPAADKKWVLPYTLPVRGPGEGRPHRRSGPQPEAFNVLVPAPVISGRGVQPAPQLRPEPREPRQHDARPEPNFEGWTERQKNAFLKFAADSENKMRLESLRLQDEYNKQLAAKLAIVKNELHETNRRNLLELQDMKLERERWALEEREAKRSLESVSAALEGLQKSYDNLRAELEGKELHIKTLNGELAKGERVADGLRHDLEALHRELHDKSELVSRLQNDLADAFLKLEVETTKSANADKDLAAASLARRELCEQNRELRAQLDELRLANKFTQTEKQALEGRNRALEAAVADLNKDALGLRTLVRSLEDSESVRVAALQEKVEQLKVELRGAQVDLIAADRRLELEGLQRDLEELRRRLKASDAENDALHRENSALQAKLEQEKALVKEHLNDLYVAKCRAHSLRTELRSLRESLKWAARPGDSGPGPAASPKPAPADLSFKDPMAPGGADAAEPAPPRRDLFAPTMFDGPDEATQARIDELERTLTELYIERDRLQSEMTRCRLGPGSPTMQRRRHFLLEGEVEATQKRINEVAAEIKKLNVN